MIKKFSLVLSFGLTLNVLNAFSGELASVSPTSRTLFTTSPTISNLNGDQVAWGGLSTPVLIDAGGNATISDPELQSLNSGNGNWAGATLTIQRAGTALSADQFSFGTTGALFSVNGSSLQSGGLTFATFTNANGVLTISFTSSGTMATTALVNDILPRIFYTNNTPSGDATLRIVLNDGSGTPNATAELQVTSDTIYITNSTDTGTIDRSNGVSFSEAVAIAALDTTGSQIIAFSSTLSGLTLTLNSVSISENLTLDSDLNSTITLSGGTITGATGTVLEFSNGTGDVLTLNAILAGDGSLKK